MINGGMINGVMINEVAPEPAIVAPSSSNWYFRRRKFRSLDLIILLGVILYEKARQSLLNA